MLQAGVDRSLAKFVRRREKRRKKTLSIQSVNVTLGLALPILLLVTWQGAGMLGLLNEVLLPTPWVIIQEFVRLTRSGELLQHLEISSWRALLGFLLGGGLGLATGLWVGFSYKTERLLDPSLQMLRMLPHLAVAPLFILWFGFDETSKILLIAKGSFFPLYVNTFLGIRSVDSKLFDVAKILQFSRWELITKLILPASLPNIFLGLRFSIGVAWLGLVVAEMMGSTEGIGFLINDARSFSLTSVVFVGVIMFAAVGKITDSLVKLLERRLLRWQDSYKGGPS